MGLLDRFEQRLDRLVNGAFARAFKAEVQPVEIAAALQRELDDHAAVVSRGRTIAPNHFEVDLSPHDHERLSMYVDTVCSELATVVREYADAQHYTVLGIVEVSLDRDDELETGIFRVRSQSRAVAVSVPTPPVSFATRAPDPAPPPGSPVPTGRLVIAGTSYPLTREVTRLGRGTDVDIRIEDPGVSRHHAEIIGANPAVLRDLGSTNGTTLDGVALRTGAELALSDGATIVLGSTTLQYRTVVSASPPVQFRNG